MKNHSDRCEPLVIELVKFIGAHQSVSLVLVLIDDSLRVIVCSVWGPVRDVRSESLGTVQWRHVTFASGTTRTYTLGISGINSGKQRAVICYNYKGEGHMYKQCTKPKQKRDDSWFKDKVLLVQAHANGQVLHKKELALLADPGVLEFQNILSIITHNAAYQADELDAYNSDYALTEVHNPDNVNNITNQDVQVMPSSKQSSVVNHSETEITSDSNIILYSYVNDTLTVELERYKEQIKVLKEGQNVEITSKDKFSDSHEQNAEIDRLKQTLSKQLREKESLMKTVTILKNDFKKEESRNIDREIALENRIKHLDNILEPKLYDGNVILNTYMIEIPDSEETLMLAEESHSKMLLKQQDPMVLENKVNTKPIDYATLNKISQDFEQRFVLQTELSVEQAFWTQNSLNYSDPDIVNVVVNSSMDNASMNVHECEKCLKIEIELLNKKDFIEKESYDKLLKSFTTLEKHCLSLEVDTQLNQEIFQRDNSGSNQNAPNFDQYFELNELTAQS
ncbi:hypothetical protein Tco_0127439 [Tanacetum coccineum]